MRIQRVTESNKSRDPDYKNRLKMKHRSNKRTGMCTEPRERSARSRRKKECSWEGEEYQDTVWERTCTASPALCLVWLCLGQPCPFLTTLQEQGHGHICVTLSTTSLSTHFPEVLAIKHTLWWTGNVMAVTGEHNRRSMNMKQNDKLFWIKLAFILLGSDIFALRLSTAPWKLHHL